MSSHYDQGPSPRRSNRGAQRHVDAPPVGDPIDVEVLFAHPVEERGKEPGPPDPRTRVDGKSQEDFERLCQDIGRGVSQVSDALAQGLSGAGDAIGHAIGQAVEGYRQNQSRAQEKAALARQQALINARFGRISSVRTSGIIRCVIGGLLTLSFGTGLIEELFLLGSMSVPSWIAGMAFTAVFFGLSLALLASGIRRIRAASDMGDIRRIMGTREAMSIAELAHLMGQKPAKLATSLSYILKNRLLPQGRMDDEQTTLMVTDEAYQHYLALRESEQRRQMEERARRAPGPAAPPSGEPVISSEVLSPKVVAFLESGDGYLRQIRQLDVDISDEAVSQRIVKIEAVVGRILARAKEEPQVIDQLGRFVDYYLPTTVKLLSAYDALEEQEAPGDNVQSSRQEIESTLDVLLQAYEKLLDATFADLSMDVSSEISVLNVVLAQEGLTQSPFDAPIDDTRDAQRKG